MTSLIISAVLYFVGLPIVSCLLCFLAGIFVDADHYLDFLLWSKRRDFRRFRILGPPHFTQIHLTDTLFHSVELIVLLAIPIYYYSPEIAIGLTLGFISHIALDHVGFNFHPLHFFLSYRIIVEKKKERFLRDSVFRRDGYKCTECSATENLQIHRRSKQKSWDSIDEWVTLCEECHIKSHGSGLFYWHIHTGNYPIQKSILEYSFLIRSHNVC